MEPGGEAIRDVDKCREAYRIPEGANPKRRNRARTGAIRLFIRSAAGKADAPKTGAF